MVGRSMRDSARNQSIISDWQKYSTAANTYFNKYGYWPGDDYEASSKWSGETNGDGNGALGTQSSGEYFQFWRHLMLAGLITGTYSGTSSSSTSLPKTQIPQAYMTHYYDTTTANQANQAFLVMSTTNLASVSTTGYGTITSPNVASLNTATFNGPDAKGIDSKIDDGLPQATTGNVIGVGNGTDCVSSAAYVTTSTAVCNLYYTYKK